MTMGMIVQNVAAHPRDLDRRRQKDARFLGDDCGDVMNRKLALLPAVLSSTKLITGPLTTADASAQFGENVVFTDLSVQAQGVVTKLIQGGSVASPYLIRGLCIVGRMRPYRYGMLGAAIASSVNGAHIPEVITPAGVPEDATALPANFDFNTMGVVAYDLFLRTYQFQYVLQGRWLMVNERGVDIGVVDSHTAPEGFGSGLYDPQADIAKANETFRATMTRNFAQANCTTADAEGEAVSPTLVELQFVTPRAPGVYGCCYPIRPHVLWPLQTYQFFFERTARVDSEHDELLAAVTAPSAITNPSTAWPAGGMTAGANGPAVYLGTLQMRYFALELGIMFRGAEFFPEDAIEWMMRFGFPYASMWLSDPTMLMAIGQVAQKAGLSGIPRPLFPKEVLNLGGAPGVVGGMLGAPSDWAPKGGENLHDKRTRLHAMVAALQQVDAGKAGGSSTLQGLASSINVPTT